MAGLSICIVPAWCPLLAATASLSDILVLIVYLGMSLGLGLLASRWLRRRGSTSSDVDHEDDYFLAGRQVPGWVNGVSFAATAVNADVGPAYCGFAVVVGLPIAFFYLPRFALAWMIAAALFAVRWRQLGVRTGPEFYAVRFGGARPRWMRMYSSLFAVSVNMVPWIGAGMLGVHKIFGPALGFESKLTTLSIVLPVLLAYVWATGFAGVVVTDVMQSFVIVAASIVLLVSVLWQHGGPLGLAEGIQASLPGSSEEILSTWPVRGHQALGPLVALAWLIVPTVGRGGSVDIEGQRIFSCRSDRDAAYMNVWAEIGLFSMLLLLTLPALGLLVNHPDLYTASPSDREKAYSLLLQEYLPSGLYGVALAALLASVMSTISSHLNYGSQTLVNDVLRQAAPNAHFLRSGSQGAVNAGRLLMVVILFAGILVTYHAESLIGIAIVLAGMYGATATIYWGQWWWWRVNFWSWLTAMVGGPLIYLALGGLHLGSWQLPGLMQFLPQTWLELMLGDSLQGATTEAAQQGLSMFQAALGMTLTLVAWIGITLVTPPESLELLKRFYVHARPAGAWGPVRRACLQDDSLGDWSPPPRGLIGYGLAIAVLGAASVSAGVLGCSTLAVGRWGESMAYFLASVVGVFFFRRAFDWHLIRLDVDSG